MRLVNEDGGEFLEVAIQQRFQFAEGFAEKAANAEFAEYIRPRAGIVFVEQVRRRDDEARLVKVLGEQRRHVGFAQADNVGQKRAAVFIENFAGIQHGLLLVFQFFKARWQIHVLYLVGQVEFAPEILVEELKVEFVRGELREGGFDLDGRDVILSHVHGFGPKLVELLEREVVVGASSSTRH